MEIGEKRKQKASALFKELPAVPRNGVYMIT